MDFFNALVAGPCSRAFVNSFKKWLASTFFFVSTGFGSSSACINVGWPFIYTQWTTKYVGILIKIHMVLKLCVYVHAGMHVRTLQGQTVPPGDASPSSLLSRFFLFFLITASLHLFQSLPLFLPLPHSVTLLFSRASLFVQRLTPIIMWSTCQGEIGPERRLTFWGWVRGVCGWVSGVRRRGRGSSG